MALKLLQENRINKKMKMKEVRNLVVTDVSQDRGCLTEDVS
jgi:hypothetical protein